MENFWIGFIWGVVVGFPLGWFGLLIIARAVINKNYPKRRPPESFS